MSILLNNKLNKVKLLLSSVVIAITLILITISIYFIWKSQTLQQSYVYLQDGNIWLANKNNQTQITFDASNDILYKYISWVKDSSSILYLKCQLSSSTCSGFKRELLLSMEEELFNITDQELAEGTPAIFGGRYAWALHGEYLVYSGKETLKVVYPHRKEEEILTWRITNPIEGVGGPLCSRIEISPDAKYFTFCNNVATLNTIWGNLYVFDSNGNLVKKFEDEDDVSTMFASTAFLNDVEITLGDEKLMKYNIEKDLLSHFLDESVSIITNSVNGKYLTCFQLSDNSYFYIEKETQKIYLEKPVDLIDPASEIDSLNLEHTTELIFAPGYAPSR